MAGRDLFEGLPVTSPSEGRDLFSDLVNPNPPEQQKQPMSGTGAFTRGAAKGLLPGLGGLAGAEAAAPLGALLGSPLGPVGSGIGALITGTAGAFGGSELINKTQDALLERFPEFAKRIGLSPEELKQAEEEHPYLTMAGGITSGFAGLRPSSELLSAAKMLAPTVEKDAPTVAKVMSTPAFNSAIGATIGGAQEAYSEHAAGEEYDPTKLGLAIAGGALGTKKTKFGEAVTSPIERGYQAVGLLPKAQEPLPTREPVKGVPSPEDIDLHNQKVDPYHNPFGNFLPGELNEEQRSIIEKDRTENGKIDVPSFSIQDYADALDHSGITGEQKKNKLDEALAQKTGFSGEATYTPEGVTDAAKAKGLNTDDTAFKDFLGRTTGNSDLAAMSQTQLHAAETAIQNVPKDSTLLSGDNAQRFTPAHYVQALDALKSPSTSVISDISQSTGLNTSDSRSLLNHALHQGDIEFSPKDATYQTVGTLPSNPDLSIKQQTFKQDVEPTGYEIKRGDTVLDRVPTQELADNAVELQNQIHQEMIQKNQKQIESLNNENQKTQMGLEQLKADGKFGTPEYQKAKDKADKAQADNRAKSDTLEQKITDLSTPVEATPIGGGEQNVNKFVLYNKDQPVKAFNTRQEAESHIVGLSNDRELQTMAASLAQGAMPQRIAAMAQTELTNRAQGILHPVTQQAMSELGQTLRKALDKYGLGHVGLHIAHSIQNGGVNGSYAAKLITIALDAERPLGTLRHEVIHALKEMGAFTAKEWSVLEKMADNEWIRRFIDNRGLRQPYEEVYRKQNGLDPQHDLTHDAGFKDYLREEAIADAFKYFDSGKKPAGFVGNMSYRLNKLFEALKNALHGMGFQTSADIFGRIEEGKLKTTAPAGEETRLSLNAPRIMGTGKIVGAPPGLDTEAHRTDLVNRMTNLLTHPYAMYAESKDWYENSGKAIATIARNDPELAERIVRLTSLYSQGNSVGGNVTAMIKSMAQIARGDKEILAGRFPNTTAKIIPEILSAKTMDTSIKGVDDKLMNFYRNLHDATFGTDTFKDASTIDRWMMRLFGYPHSEDMEVGGANSVSNTQYKYAKDLIERIGAEQEKRTGEKLTPRQIQSVLWTYIKNITEFDKLKAEGKGADFKPSTLNFDDYLKRATAHVTWESRPSTSVDLIPGIHNASREQQEDFNRAVKNIFTDKNGNDEIIKALGNTQLYSSEFSNGAYDSAISPNIITKLVLQKDEKGYLTKMADMYAKIIGYVTKQDAVPWYRPDPTASGKFASVGYRVSSEHPMSAAFEDRLFKHLNEKIPGIGYTKVGDSFDFINFRGEDGKPFLMNDKKFQSELQKALETFAPDIKFNMEGFRTESNYLSNDWKENKDGQGYLQGFSAKELADLQPRIDAWRKAYEATAERFGKEYGWDKPANIEEQNAKYSLALGAKDPTTYLVSELHPNGNGDLGYMPKETGLRPMPIRLPIGSHTPGNNYGAAHILERMKSDMGHRPKVMTKDLLEDLVLNAEHLAQTFTTIYKEPNAQKYLLFNPVDRQVMIVRPTDKDWEIVTMYKMDTPAGRGELFWRGKNVQPPATKEFLSLQRGVKVKAGAAGVEFPAVNVAVKKRRVITPEDIARETASSGNLGRLSIRAPETPEFKRWFGDSKVVDEEGKPKVMYHGTARDISEFKAKQANAIFVTDKPKFAENFSDLSENYMMKEAFNRSSPEEKIKIQRQALELAKKQGDIPPLEYSLLKRNLDVISTSKYDIEDLNYTSIPTEIESYVNDILKKKMESGPNIMPVYVKSEKPFDYENQSHIDAVKEKYKEVLYDNNKTGKFPEEFIRNGHWTHIENKDIQSAIRKAGFDGFYVNEGGVKNLAVYDPSQIKSAIGNRGTYDINNPDIRYSLQHAERAEELRGIISDHTLSELKDELMNFEGKPVNKSVSPSDRKEAEEALAPFYKKAEEVKTSFDETIRKIADSLNATAKTPGIKEIGRAAEKLVNEEGRTTPDGGYDGRLIKDLVRSTIVVDNEKDIPKAIEELSKAFNIKRIKNRYESVPESGYRDVLLNAELPNGLLAEIQINVPEMIVAKHSGHHLYTILRNESEGSEKYNHLTDLSKRLYDEAYNSLKNRMSSGVAFEPFKKNEALGKEEPVTALTKEPSESLKTGVPSTSYKVAPEGVENISPPKEGSLPQRFSIRNMVNDPTLSQRVDDTTTARQDKGFAERMVQAFSTDSMRKFRQNWVNQLESIEHFAKMRAEKYGDRELLADVSAAAAASQSLRASTIAAASFREGIPVFRKGYTYVSNENGNVKGLMDVFAPLMKFKDPEVFRYFQFYAGAQRGKRLNAEGREYLFTPTDLRHARKLEAQFPEFKQVFDEYQKYNQGLVQYMVDTGVISKANAAKWTQNWDYIPFYRAMDEGGTLGPKVFSNISGVVKPKTLKGGEAPLADFLETVTRNARAAIESGMKNEAGRRVIRDVTDLGLAQKTTDKAGFDVVKILNNGVEENYRVADPLLVEALKGLNIPQPPWLSLIAKPANLLRNFTTKMPDFMIANMMRDSIAASISSGTKMIPVVDTFKQFGKIIAGQSPEAVALARAGLGSYDFQGDIAASAKGLASAMRKQTGTRTAAEQVLYPAEKFWEMLDHGSHASELATRAEVFKRTLERTGNEAEAIYQATQILDFSRKGSNPLIRTVSALVPFFNARIQGLDVLYRAGFGKMATENKATIQKAMMARSMMLLGLSTAYWMMVHDDDEYKKLSKEEKDNYWIIPSVKLNDKPLRFPIPFELGALFKVLPERLLEVSFGEDTPAEFRESMVRNVQNNFNINLPAFINPVIEDFTNHSFFTGEQLVGRGLQDESPRFQYTAGTTGLAKALGKELDYSPIKIDNYIRGYTGNMGIYTAQLLDSMFSVEGMPTQATTRVEQLPVIKRFFAGDSGNLNAYYDLKKQVDEVTRTMSALERSGNMRDLEPYIKEKMPLIMMKEYVGSVEKNMKQIREARHVINESTTMSPDDKRAMLDNLHDAELALTSRVKVIRNQFLK